MTWYVYIVECRNGHFYTGITNNVAKRVAAHNAGKGSKAVKAFGLPVVLRRTLLAADKSHALKVEARIKRYSHAQKAQFVKHY